MKKYCGYKIMLAAAFSLACMQLSGCLITVRTNGDKEAVSEQEPQEEIDKVEKYVKEELLTDSFKIDPEPYDVTGEDGFKDTVWTVHDEKNDVSFHVSNDAHWGMETLEREFTDDYDDCVFEKNMSAIKQSLLSYEVTETDGLKCAEIEAEFTDRAGLDGVICEIEKVCDYFSGNGYHDMEIPYCIKYMNPIRDNIKGKELNDGDCKGWLNTFDKEKSTAEYETKYLVCALDYRFDDALADFTDQEIKDASASAKKLGVKKGGKTVIYDDLIANDEGSGGDGLSFGTLYELLERENVDVRGTNRHYSFEGSDGHKYEISYDFNDLATGEYDDSGTEKKGYYYIKDDEKIPMSYYRNNHFSSDDVKNMTDLDIVFE